MDANKLTMRSFQTDEDVAAFWQNLNADQRKSVMSVLARHEAEKKAAESDAAFMNVPTQMITTSTGTMATSGPTALSASQAPGGSSLSQHFRTQGVQEDVCSYQGCSAQEVSQSPQEHPPQEDPQSFDHLGFDDGLPAGNPFVS